MKGDFCEMCGQDEKPKGEVWIECCSRCNELQYVGICNWCSGTGFEIENPISNTEMILKKCRETGGYLCGLDKQ